MNKFTNKLFLRALAPDELEALGASDANYEVVSPFSYQSGILGQITVPAGLVTDFASIPRGLWSLLDPEDPVILFPSVIHDYLYTAAGKLPNGITYTREDADGVLKEAMGVCGASNWKQETVYIAVRSFGGSHWAT